MFDEPTYGERRERRKTHRRKRSERLRRQLPAIREFCARNQIEMRDIPDGCQFRRRGYILSWRFPTNRLVLQRQGESESQPFEVEAEPGRTRVIAALERFSAL